MGTPDRRCYEAIIRWAVPTLRAATVAVTRSLGSKGLKPLVTTTDFATLTQEIKAAAPLAQCR